MTHVEEFLKFLADHDLTPSDGQVIDDDKPHYFHVEGDRRNTKKASYCLASDGDGFAYGWVCSHRTGEVINWHSKSKRKATPEEKAEWKRKRDEKRAQSEARQAGAKAASRKEAMEIWRAASVDGASEYLTRKDVTLPGVRYDGSDIIVPLWRDGALVAVQRIKPDGDKLFQQGSDHIGAYYAIKGDASVISICEGAATAGTIAQATGWSVIAAINAGNLKPVAQAMRKKYADARIVIAADNDHETAARRPDVGNVGMDKAQQAAVAIGGAQVFAPDTEQGVSDWNDVAARHGIDAVRDGLMRVTPAPAVMDDAEYEIDYGDEGDVVEDERDPMAVIRPLGHNRGSYYFFPKATGQVMEFSATALGRSQNLYQLAPRGFWEMLYAPEDNMGKICEYASAQLIELCQQKGVFSLEDARGVGVWRDSGSLVVNCGHMIVGEGIRCAPSEYDGDYVYEAGPRVIDMDAEPLSVQDAARFREICKSLTWRRPQYGDFLAGWCVIAGVGGCLDWRSHIFITGQKGSGKSTVMDDIVMGAIHGIAIKRDGGTTEPGIRKAIGMSSRPFVMDEAEGESAARRAQMQLILEYFRNASSGATVENGNASYVARSAACFGAINPRIDQGADADRWSILELVPNMAADRDAHYKKLLADIRDVITKDFPDRLLVRTVANLDVLLHNIEVFVDVFSAKLGNKRAGDQVGTLMAGAYSLTSSKRVTQRFVEDWVSAQDWEWSELSGGTADAETLVGYIMSHRVRYDQDGMGRESTIGEMIWRVHRGEGVAVEAAARGLGSVGIKIDGDRLVISNTSPRIKDALKDTPWGASWKRTLGDYPGSDNCGGRVVYFAAGIKSRATSIPLADALGGDSGGDDGFEMEGFE